jgi:ATP-dependent DNA helicase DinG
MAARPAWESARLEVKSLTDDGHADVNAILSLFADDGPLARHYPGFRPRESQNAMTAAVAQTLATRGVLVVEAGTGTGKTLAYLVPALLAGGKTLVSTGTKALQDQLFQRDIPALRRALDVPIEVALLKGRANYICLHHLARQREDGRFTSREEAAVFARIDRFAASSLTGDRGEATDIPENHSAWRFVISSRESCLGGECSHFRDCHVMAARKRALAAELVVINHHLFFADLWLKDEGVAELLPAANTVIFDEAHQLPETATAFFGQRVSTGQLIELAQDSLRLARVHAADVPDFARLSEALETAVRAFRLSFSVMALKLPAERVLADGQATAAWESFHPALARFLAALDLLAPRHAELAQAAARATGLQTTLTHWWQTSEAGEVRWLETTARSAIFHTTPLSIATVFGAQVGQNPRAWVFTSATLAARGDFSHFLDQLGLPHAQTLALDSPFDYPRQGVLYVPENLPAPNSPAHTEALIEAALPVIALSRGRAFLLFTSWRAMEQASQRVRKRFEELGWAYPVLVQGEAPKNALLDRFRQSGNAVLLGSFSFWEGVDVPGEALSVVVIDKLPFTPPDDPVIAARLRALEAAGGNPFMDYQVPEAIIALKQGAGRLIRSETDHGVLMLGDPRLASKPYGRRILDALPQMTRTRRYEVVERFFAWRAQQAAAVALPD